MEYTDLMYDPYSNHYNIPSGTSFGSLVGDFFRNVYIPGTIANFSQYLTAGTLMQQLGVPIKTVTFTKQTAIPNIIFRPQQSQYTGVHTLMSKWSLFAGNSPVGGSQFYKQQLQQTKGYTKLLEKTAKQLMKQNSKLTKEQALKLAETELTQSVPLQELNFGTVRWSLGQRQVQQQYKKLMGTLLEYAPSGKKMFIKPSQLEAQLKNFASSDLAKTTSDPALKQLAEAQNTNAKQVQNKLFFADTFSSIQNVMQTYFVTDIIRAVTDISVEIYKQKKETERQIQTMQYYRRLSGIAYLPEVANRHNTNMPMTAFEESQIMNQVQNVIALKQIVSDTNLIGGNPYARLYL